MVQFSGGMVHGAAFTLAVMAHTITAARLSTLDCMKSLATACGVHEAAIFLLVAVLAVTASVNLLQHCYGRIRKKSMQLYTKFGSDGSEWFQETLTRRKFS